MKTKKTLNILFFTDIHQNIDAVKNLKFSEYDLILCGGDFLDLAKPDFNMVKDIIDLLPVNTYVIPGNCDKDINIIEYLKKKLNYIHLQKANFENIPLLGIGYCRNLWQDLLIYRNFFMNDNNKILNFYNSSNLKFLLKFSGINVNNDGSIFVSDEKEAYNSAKDFIDKFVYFTEDEINVLFNQINTLQGGIIITHSPPANTLDKLEGLPNIGCNIIANGIKKTNPSLVLCGHFHELSGKSNINDTIVFNPGALKDNKYGIIKYDTDNNKIDVIFKTI